MHIVNKDFFKKIDAAYAANQIIFLSYWSYPLFTKDNGYIAKDDRTVIYNTTEVPDARNSIVANIVDHYLNEGVKRKGWKRDNKTGVKCSVPGIEIPVYFVSFDHRRIITTEINTRNGTTEYPFVTS